MRRIIAGTLLALALGAVTLTAAPKPEMAPTISLNTVATFSAAADGSTIYPSIGDWVTFTVTFPKSVERYGPRIVVSCYQNDEVVYAGAGPYYQSFKIGGAGSLWVYDEAPADRQSPAHCVAELFY